MQKKMPNVVYPVLFLRDIVVFPEMVAPLFIGRPKSITALEKASKEESKVFIVTQKNSAENDPKIEDVYSTGVISSVIQLLHLPDGTVKALVEGKQRARVVNYLQKGSLLCAETELMETADENTPETEALTRALLKQFGDYLKINRRIPPEILSVIGQVPSAARLSDLLASYVPAKIEEKQKLLEEMKPSLRLAELIRMIEVEIAIVNTESKIRSRIRGQVEKNHKEHYIVEQIKALQKEIDEDDVQDDMRQMEDKIKNLQLTDEARDKAKAEFKKLKTMSPLSSEASIIRNYIDWITGIPWSNPAPIKSDINHSEEMLNNDHFGLDNVKERILEYLAVQGRTVKFKGPILCLVGPPGVGKTSLAKSIAEATGRPYVKIALGGVRDEAEIRGHRRTYLGSLPGKLIQSMKKAKFSNPLILLDEIDKMSNDFRGDPAAAMLEVLDPEQNHKFNDHYLEIDYDLSDVMFIATANTLNLPRPLLDRMEILRIPGYTEEEKLEIARRHLIPKLLESHALKAEEWSINKEALTDLIRYYTREAGVRSLEREIANLMRKAVKEIVSGKKQKLLVSRKNLEKFAKVKKYSYGKKEESDLVGITNGLAYTETGGDILQIEAVLIPNGKSGKGSTKYTGNMEKVMQESIEAAYSYVRSRSLDFGIQPEYYQNNDIHIHVPEGATPKDGPSAGIAMCVSIVSVLTGIAVKSHIAMTGEITLRGRVLPIGGLKEKLLGALRSGIKTVLIPSENLKDLAEIPDNIKNQLEIIPVTTAGEVISYALVKPVENMNSVSLDIKPKISHDIATATIH